MPEKKNRLKKRQKSYAVGLQRFDVINQRDIFYAEKKAVADSLRLLSARINELSPYDMTGQEISVGLLKDSLISSAVYCE